MADKSTKEARKARRERVEKAEDAIEELQKTLYMIALEYKAVSSSNGSAHKLDGFNIKDREEGYTYNENTTFYKVSLVKKVGLWDTIFSEVPRKDIFRIAYSTTLNKARVDILPRDNINWKQYPELADKVVKAVENFQKRAEGYLKEIEICGITMVRLTEEERDAYTAKAGLEKITNS